jgi:hypothetical protein
MWQQRGFNLALLHGRSIYQALCRTSTPTQKHAVSQVTIAAGSDTAETVIVPFVYNSAASQ